MNLIHILGQESNGWQPWAIAIAVVVLIVLIAVFAILFQFIGLYVRALVSGRGWRFWT